MLIFLFGLFAIFYRLPHHPHPPKLHHQKLDQPLLDQLLNHPPPILHHPFHDFQKTPNNIHRYHAIIAHMILQAISHNKIHIHHIINIAFSRFFLSFLFDFGIIALPITADAIKNTHISHINAPCQSKPELLELFDELEFVEYVDTTVGSFWIYE
ncbi:MAG: hypothetical protein WCG25_03195 [bacterium]